MKKKKPIKKQNNNNIKKEEYRPGPYNNEDANQINIYNIKAISIW